MQQKINRLIILAGIVVMYGFPGIHWPFLPQDCLVAGTGKATEIDIDSDPKTVIQRSIEGYGGLGRIKEIKGLRLEGTLVLHRNHPEPLEGRFADYYRFPDHLRSEITIGTRSKAHIFDGLKAWTIEGPLRIPGADFVAEGLRTSIKNIPFRLLLEALDERSILDSIVLDKLDGREVFVVPFNDSDGAQYWLWFNSETFLLERIDYTLITSQGPSAMQVRFDKYRKFDGIQTATLITFYSGESISQENRIEKAVYNPELPDSLFTLPKSGD